jgi:hypothetical protein
MNDYITRALVALVLAALLWAQARRARERPNRRRSFELSAGALLAFAAFNGALSVGIGAGALQIALVGVGMLLLLGAIVAFLSSFRSGEMSDAHDRIAAAAREYHARREERERREDR